MTRQARILMPLLAGLTALAGGCSFAPEYERPAAPTPAAWPGAAATQPAPASAADAAPLPWREFFTDPNLRQLIATALKNNRDLRLAALNVQRAQGLYGIQRAELWPAVNAGAGTSQQRLPADVAGTSGPLTARQYSVDLGVAAWEIDFFGRIRSLSDAALQEYLATEQAHRSTQILLVSGVAGAYLALGADRESLKLAKDTLAAQQGAYDLIKHRLDRGLAPELDLYRARTQVEAARGEVARFTQLAAQDRNALNLLLGAAAPDDLLPADLSGVAALPALAAGVPSEVLLRRPDILAAEDRLKGAYANIGAARSAFFPRISLTAAAGTASSELSRLFQAGQGAWSYSAQVVMPIFDARVWAALKVSAVDKQIAIAQYEKAIQTGFREVADALAVRQTVGEQVAAQTALVKAVAETYRLAGLRYDKGMDSYLDVLDAQRTLLAAQEALIALQLADVASQVQLYAVLGGGWQGQ